jgi:hypothetical protein
LLKKSFRFVIFYLAGRIIAITMLEPPVTANAVFMGLLYFTTTKATDSLPGLLDANTQRL